MTVMVAERAGAKVAQGRVTSSTYDTYNTRTRARPQQSSPASPRASQPAQQPAPDSGNPAPVGMKTAQQAFRGVKLAPGNRAYQPVLLAEFLAAAVIITVAPIATGGSETAKAKGGISPYDTGDLRQLVAVGAVYFVLALASSGNSGRLSAWLGGLVLLAIAMSKMAHGTLTAVFNSVSQNTGQSGDTTQTA